MNRDAARRNACATNKTRRIYRVALKTPESTVWPVRETT